MSDAQPEPHPQFPSEPRAAAEQASGNSGPADDSRSGWNGRIDAFWETFDEDQPDCEFDRMRQLVAGLPAGDAEGLYEWASIHDSLGFEAEAVEFYRGALAAGLAGDRLPQAKVQLASTLRNLGQFDEAIAILESVGHTEVTGDAHLAFLALTHFSAGRPEHAARIAVAALAGTLPRYSRSVARYAASLPFPDRP